MVSLLRLSIFYAIVILFTAIGSKLEAAQAAPSTIRVGQQCQCSSCASVITVSMETYVKRVLAHEWIPSWHKESLKAGAIAVRSYAASRVYDPIASNYDICDSTCCQVYSGGQHFRTDEAADATKGIYLVNSAGNIGRAEYSAENNDINGRDGCGNCKINNVAGDGVCLSDSVCCGTTQNGHGRGMCQWGTQRWATNGDGMDYGWIVDHYYQAYGWHRANLLGPPPPPPLPTVDPDNPALVTDVSGNVWLAAIKTDGELFTRRFDAAAGVWNGPTSHGTGWSLNASPALAGQLDGTMRLFAVKSNGVLMSRKWMPSGPEMGWSNFSPQGEDGGWATDGGPSAVRQLSGQITFAAVKANGSLFHRTYNPATNTWGDFGPHSTAWSTKAAPCLIAGTDGRMWLFAVKADGDMYHRSWTSSGWTSFELDSTNWSAAAGPTGVARPNGAITWAAVKGDGDIYTRNYQNGAWTSYELHALPQVHGRPGHRRRSRPARMERYGCSASN
jgi:hypothetical protein